MTTKTSTFWSTSPGKKIAMAISGIVIFGFVVAHMLGNLQIFYGPERINAYAAFLQGLGPLLWVFRIVMLLALGIHFVAALLVTLQNMAARPQKYTVHAYRKTTFAARTMWLGGPAIALFVIYHLGHLTVGCVHAEFTDNVYNNIVVGFQTPWVSAVYITAMCIVGLHLYHGLSSMFQSLGLSHPRWNKWRNIFAVCFSFAVTILNTSIPASVLLGILAPV
jgi:succinate dehydrogenase cytochrome b subunit